MLLKPFYSLLCLKPEKGIRRVDLLTQPYRRVGSSTSWVTKSATSRIPATTSISGNIKKIVWDNLFGEIAWTLFIVFAFALSANSIIESLSNLEMMGIEQKYRVWPVQEV